MHIWMRMLKCMHFLSIPVRSAKVVQTRVDPSVHARLWHIARKRSMPLKAVLREALQSYVDRVEGDVEEDPAFRMISCWDLKGRGWSERKDWRE